MGSWPQTEGMPTFLMMPDFVPGESHGYTTFIEPCDTVLMGRSTFLPALGAPAWPWPGLHVFVLTSQPLPPETPPDVVAIAGGPAAAVERLRTRGSGGDVHVVGGPRTIEGLAAVGGLDRLELVITPHRAWRRRQAYAARQLPIPSAARETTREI